MRGNLLLLLLVTLNRLLMIRAILSCVITRAASKHRNPLDGMACLVTSDRDTIWTVYVPVGQHAAVSES